jgi:hypothetical protein
MRALSGLCTTALVLAFVGCSGDDTADQIAAVNKSNIQRVSNLYAAYQNMKNSSGPKTEAELKEFVKTYDPSKLSAMGVDANNLDAVFVSERDGQPFKVKYGVAGGRGAVAAVVFEATGKDGRKQVGFTGGTVEDVDDSRYKQLWDGKAAPPATPGQKDFGRPTGGPPPGAPRGPGK